MDPERLRAFALDLADTADAISSAHFGGPVPAVAKPDGTPVTEADRAIEAALRARIAEAEPGQAFSEVVARADAAMLRAKTLGRDQVLASGEPGLPFCLCWANEPWSRRWNGRNEDVLQEQRYSPDDDVAHLRALHCDRARLDVRPRSLRVGRCRLFGYSALYYCRALTPHESWAKTVPESPTQSVRDAMTLRTATKVLLTLALGLPVVQVVLICVAGLLSSMGDQAGAAIIGHVGTGCQVLWTVAIVALVIVLAILNVNEPPVRED